MAADRPSRWRVWFARFWWGDAAEATLGRRGERAAEKHLKKLGFRLVSRNKRLRQGEADLIMWSPDRNTLVLVEVKTRRTDPAHSQPPPEASVHAHKARKLISLGHELSRLPRYRGVPVRIDVVAVDWPLRGAPQVRHFVDAVRG